MAEHVVARVGELRPGERKVVQVRGLSIGLFRLGDAYYALRNLCPHQYGPVCQGGIGSAIVAGPETDWQPALAMRGEVVACPWHGLEFHIPTGQCLAYPDVRLRRYPVRVEDDEIRIVL